MGSVTDHAPQRRRIEQHRWRLWPMPALIGSSPTRLIEALLRSTVGQLKFFVKKIAVHSVLKLPRATPVPLYE